MTAKPRRVLITLECVSRVPLDRLRRAPLLELLVAGQRVEKKKVKGELVPLVEIQQATAQNIER